MKLSTIPWIEPLAEWIWSTTPIITPLVDVKELSHVYFDNDDEDGEVEGSAPQLLNSQQLEMVTASQCLSYVDVWDLPQFQEHCATALITKLSGVAIIVGACFNKLPTLLNLVEAQSAEGLSAWSQYTEALFFANASIYSWQEGHPWTAYGENLVLGLQTLVMIVMLWHYSSTATKEKVVFAIGFVLYCVAITLYLPEDWRYVLHAFNDLIILYSGGLQVLETWRTKHTGAQSVMTTGMNWIGEFIRILTTLEEADGDINMLLSYGLCVALSTTMLFQYFYYLPNTNKFYEKQQQQQQQLAKQQQKKKTE